MSQNNLSSSKTCAPSLALKITCIVFIIWAIITRQKETNRTIFGGKIWSNVIDIRLQKSAGCAAGTSFFFLTCFKKVVLMSVYHFIPGPTLADYSPASRHSRAGAIWRAVSKPRPTTSSFLSSFILFDFPCIPHHLIGKSSFLYCYVHLTCCNTLTKFIEYDCCCCRPYSGIISRAVELIARKK